MKTTNQGTFRGMVTAMLFAAGIATTIATGGGGGSGSPPPPPPPPPPAMLAITADNALDVSTALIVGIGMSFDIGEITGPDVSGEAAAATPRLLSLMRIGDLPSKPLPSGSAKLEGCLLSGTVDVTGTLADPNTLTVGDRIVAVFVDCDDGDGYVISGTVDITVSAVQGDFMTEVFLLGLDVLMTDVEVTVHVRDRGVGFVLSEVPTDRMGVRESILGRLERHGGRASVTSVPGEGTRVELVMETP